ncbi:MAG: hypothetical protein Q9169_003669 [Polycauliona sp. 2 TL-2023]
MDPTSRPSKRLNQTDISSYFSIHSSPSLTLAHDPLNQGPSPSPQLPPTIQSSLLNVGMRVRKAVPEGYKTTKRTPFPITRDGRVGSGGGYAELVPFCGISKVGGYMAQDFSSSAAGGGVGIDVSLPEKKDNMVFEDEMFGGSMPSSQESVLEEDMITERRGLKRSLHIEDEEAEEEEERSVEGAWRYNASLGFVNMESPMALRPIAQARTRRPGVNGSRLKGAGDGDFGEAPFLRDLCEDMEFGG